ncbi:MAG TPA: prepilin-type N-terminal cleavage/methylation domain-containing protein [Gammaproteobacteria bacterium]|nr:prepilin-type N-terminal cleavage/methylation domain-containing protein [Gammaproteobacteria bacterium]
MRIAKPTLQHGFTLVELLIVVIILGILAAIVVPQFAASTTDAEDAAVQTNLQNLRSAVEFYRQEHGHWPSAVDSTGATCPAGVASGGVVNTEASFVSALTEFSFNDGKTCTGTDGTLLGPYVQEIPANTKITTVADQTKVKIVTAGVLNPAPDGTTGWVFDNVTGQLLPNNN